MRLVKMTLLPLLLLESSFVYSQLQINEIMQSNVDCIMDDMNEFPDSWVELYNAGPNVENLANFKISISDNVEEAWQLPESLLEPNSYAIIYCDKVGSGLHTDFRLESGKGCCVYLYANNQLIDKIEELKKQPAPNIAYGRENDEKKWGYMLKSTPGITNKGIGVVDRNQILDDPIFSVEGHILTTQEREEIAILKPDNSPSESIIVYTTDGSEPTRENGTLYDAPIIIDKTTIIKAKLLCEGWLSQRAITHSYIFHNREMTLPVISLTTDDQYVNDSKIGIYVEGDYKEGEYNYLFNWRRPVQMEFFENPYVTSSINQLCEFRIAGASTRKWPLKSMNVYANKRFGTKRFSYDFFPDQKPDITEFKSLVLRNGGGFDFYSTYIRDALIQRTMGQNADMDYQAYRPAILYLNGQYKGIINIRERTDEDFIYSNYNGLEDVDMIENTTKYVDGLYVINTKLVNGSLDNYLAFKSFYEQQAHSLAEYSEWMDWKEYINLVAMNLYFCNRDCFGNNNILWRSQDGGKWRWIAKDTGYSSGISCDNIEYDILKWLYYNKEYDSSYWGANSEEATMLFRHLMDDEDFKREFIDRLCIYMGDFLNENGIRVLIDKMYDTIKDELSYHKMLYMPEQATTKVVADELVKDDYDKLKMWIHQRTNIFYQQIGDFYNQGRAIPLFIDTSSDKDSQFTFNDVCLKKSLFDGKFFAGRRLKLARNSEMAVQTVEGWVIEKTISGSLERNYVEGTTLDIDMPDCDSVSITPVLSESGVTDINIDVKVSSDKHTNTTVYNLNGQRVSRPTSGLYILNGQKVVY